MSQYFKMSHAMMLDEPIGYAHKGPPLQKKAIAQSLEKSKGLGAVIGVVSGVMTAGTGFAMWSAAQGASLAAISGGAMMAGGVMTAVGAATGNKKLSKIGGVLSLAGGIGSLGADKLAGADFGTTMGNAGRDAMSSVSKAFTGAADKLGLTSGAADTVANQTVSLTSGAGSAGAEGVGSALTGGTEAASSTAGAFGSQAGGAGVGSGVAPSQTIGLGGDAIGSGISVGGGQQGLLLKAGSGSSVSGSLSSPTLTAMQGTANMAAPTLANAGSQASGGLLTKAWDFAKTPDGFKMIGNTLQSLGGADEEEMMSQRIGEMARQFDQTKLAEELARQRGNNPGAIIYNPNDPNASKIIAAAQQAGIQAQPLTINQNANVQSPMDAMKKQGATA